MFAQPFNELSIIRTVFYRPRIPLPAYVFVIRVFVALYLPLEARLEKGIIEIINGGTVRDDAQCISHSKVTFFLVAGAGLQFYRLEWLQRPCRGPLPKYSLEPTVWQ